MSARTPATIGDEKLVPWVSMVAGPALSQSYQSESMESGGEPGGSLSPGAMTSGLLRPSMGPKVLQPATMGSAVPAWSSEAPTVMTL